MLFLSLQSSHLRSNKSRHATTRKNALPESCLILPLMIRSTFNAALVTSLSILIFSFNPGEGVAGKCTKTHALHNTTTAVAGRYISLLQSPNWCTQLNSVWTFHCKTDKTCLPLNIAKILHTDNLFGKASVHLLSRFFLPRSRTHTKHYLTLTLMERKHDVLSK